MPNARGYRSQIYKAVAWSGCQKMAREGRKPFVPKLGDRRLSAIRAGGEAALPGMLQSQFEVTLSFCFPTRAPAAKFPFLFFLHHQPCRGQVGPLHYAAFLSRGQGDNSSALGLGAAFPCLPGAGPAIPEGPQPRVLVFLITRTKDMGGS